MDAVDFAFSLQLPTTEKIVLFRFRRQDAISYDPNESLPKTTPVGIIPPGGRSVHCLLYAYGIILFFSMGTENLPLSYTQALEDGSSFHGAQLNIRINRGH